MLVCDALRVPVALQPLSITVVPQPCIPASRHGFQHPHISCSIGCCTGCGSSSGFLPRASELLHGRLRVRLKVSGSHFLCSPVFYYIATNIIFLRGTINALPCPYDLASKRRGWPQHHLMASKLHSVKPWTSNPHLQTMRCRPPASTQVC